MATLIFSCYAVLLVLIINATIVEGATSGCIQWKPAGGNLPVPNGTFTPGNQGMLPSAFCRFNGTSQSSSSSSSLSSSSITFIGKHSKGPCYFCSPTQASKGEHNGTAQLYELATVTSTCGVQFVNVANEGKKYITIKFTNTCQTDMQANHCEHTHLLFCIIIFFLFGLFFFVKWPIHWLQRTNYVP